MVTFSPNSYLVIFRHAEAVKNLEKMHGGGTQDLTKRGQKQAQESALGLGLWLSHNDAYQEKYLFFQSEERSRQTAVLLGEQLKIRPQLAEGISGVGLGVIESLNEEELERQHPDVATALANWRAGTSGLMGYPKVPGSESMADFATRIGNGLSNIIKANSCSVLVGTTSVINMASHLLQNHGKFIREKYDFINYELAGFTIWKIDEGATPTKIFSNFL